MRLISTEADGRFSLTNFTDNIPSYAILSHTWEADDQEITFRDLTDGKGTGKSGYRKIQFCSKQAKNDGLQYFWVDSCCIDKSSSAELSDAINSMFRWYRNASKCYVYLSDISTAKFSRRFGPFAYERNAFRNSRWFTRGWTVQELLAPASVEFFSRDGVRLGDKESLKLQIQQITGIPIQALQGSPLSKFSVETRMSWIANRETTIAEDMVYSILGIFEVHMPLIYGEGVINAMRRLGKEIDDSSSHDKRAVQRVQNESEFIVALKRMPLSFAAKHGLKAVVKELLATGRVDVDSKDEYGYTPLSWAAQIGHEAVVKLLLATGKVDINSTDLDGHTPLSWAAWKGHEAVVKQLLVTGMVDADSKDKDSHTPLFRAAQNGHEAVVKLLLATGKVDAHSRDRYGYTPLSLAARNGHEAVVKQLRATGKVDASLKDKDDNVPLLRSTWKTENAGDLMIQTGTQPSGVVARQVEISYRLHWNCTCGYRHYDDFVETIPGSLSKLVNYLQQDGVTSHLKVRRTDNSILSKLYFLYLPVRNMIVHITTEISSGLAVQTRSAATTQSGQRAAVQPANPESTSSSRSSGASGPYKTTTTRHQRTAKDLQNDYMLLCSDEIGWLTTREDLNVSKIISDRELFELFRSRLQRRKRWGRRRISLKTIQRISFVKFALRQDHEVDQLQPDRIPPEAETHYDFHERVPGYVPPIGNRYLMHRLSNTAHCRDSTFCLTQIPKRVGGRPQYGSAPDHFTGWGLYFEETFDAARLCVCGMVAFVLSLVFGMVWSVTKKSIQDGFAVASYILALETLTIGTVQVAIGLGWL